MPSHDRALWALGTWLDSWVGIGRIAVGMALRRERLARGVLHKRDGALADERDRNRSAMLRALAARVSADVPRAARTRDV